MVYSSLHLGNNYLSFLPLMAVILLAAAHKDLYRCRGIMLELHSSAKQDVLSNT
ncbi:hypothetical protein [Candidatus Hoaglandella endobia]|uniref:hypothetical protein n=1 Tax=Candidatus Hoaglandella endobia TaxID=1778263 RepID=UPI0013153454|nr:hypothetical protein [Candidatus Hoaglandella endobia]